MTPVCLYALLLRSSGICSQTRSVSLLDSRWQYLAASNALIHNVQSIASNTTAIGELPTHSGHMRPGIVRHQEVPRAHHVSIGSDSRSEGFTSPEDNPRPSLIHHQTGHAGLCYRQHNIHHDDPSNQPHGLDVSCSYTATQEGRFKK